MAVTQQCPPASAQFRLKLPSAGWDHNNIINQSINQSIDWLIPPQMAAVGGCSWRAQLPATFSIASQSCWTRWDRPEVFPHQFDVYFLSPIISIIDHVDTFLQLRHLVVLVASWPRRYFPTAISQLEIYKANLIDHLQQNNECWELATIYLFVLRLSGYISAANNMEISSYFSWRNPGGFASWYVPHLL